MRRTVIAVIAVTALTSCSGQAGHAHQLARAACHDVADSNIAHYGGDSVMFSRGVAEADRAAQLDDHWLALASALDTFNGDNGYFDYDAFAAVGRLCRQV